MTKNMIAVVAFALLVPFCSFAQNASLINGHEYVDLGLSVKWATCNVGSTFTASYLGFRDENLEKHWGNRYYGIPIRPVSD